MKTTVKAILILILIASLASCSSDSYANAGGCDESGVSKIIKNKVAVCTGLKGKFKWYYEGKFYSDMILLGKIQDEFTDIEDPINQEITNQGLWPAYMKFDSTLSIEEIITYTNGDSRWDSLIEAKSVTDSEDAKQSYLLDERFRLNGEYRAGKASRSEAYDAQQKQIAQMNGSAATARTNYRKKLAVLKAKLMTEYQITDPSILLFFLARQSA